MATLNINVPCVCSYPHLNKPRAGFDGAKEKYSLDILIPEGNVELVNAVLVHEQQAIQDGLNKVFNGKTPSKTS